MLSIIAGASLFIAASLQGQNGPVEPSGPLEVTNSRLKIWREITGLGPSTPDLAIAEDIAWNNYWAHRADTGEETRVRPKALEDLAVWRLADQRWRAWVRAGARKPTAKEVQAAIDSRPQPVKQWQLSNILLEYPEGADSEARLEVEIRLEELRQQVEAGDDFGELAERFSDSQTRIRKGRMGYVRLDDLAANLRAVVAGLRPGSLSPVVALDSGVVLLQCTDIHEPEPPDIASLRVRITSRLQEDQRQQAMADAIADLERRVVIDPLCDKDEMTPSTCISRLRLDGGTLEIRSEHLAATQARTSLEERSDEQLFASIEALGLRFLAAESAGLTAGPSWTALVDDVSLRVRAAEAMDQLVRDHLEPPSEHQLRALYEARVNSFYQAARFRLRTLEVPIRKDWDRSFYSDLSHWGEQLSAGQITFDEIRHRVADKGVDQSLGWQSSKQVFALGKAVEEALLKLQPGAAAGPLQESRSLYFVQLLEKSERRRYSFDEVRSVLEAALLDREFKRELTRLRADILSDLEWTIVE